MSSTFSPNLKEPGFVGQLIAGAGAVLCLLGAFGIAFAAVGVTLVIVGVVVSAPFASFAGPFIVEWWTALAICALVCLTGFALGFLATALGGVVLAVGAIAALVVVALGSPALDPGVDRAQA
ncbi:MAG: hypothetical protein ACSLFI_03290 [Solirubrobacterales bacterium]